MKTIADTLGPRVFELFERPLELVVVPAGREVPARRLWCETLLLLRKTDRFRFVRRHPPRKRRRGENVVIMLHVGFFPTEPLEAESPNAARTGGEREDPKEDPNRRGKRRGKRKGAVGINVVGRGTITTVVERGTTTTAAKAGGVVVVRPLLVRS